MQQTAVEAVQGIGQFLYLALEQAKHFHLLMICHARTDRCDDLPQTSLLQLGETELDVDKEFSSLATHQSATQSLKLLE